MGQDDLDYPQINSPLKTVKLGCWGSRVFSPRYLSSPAVWGSSGMELPEEKRIGLSPGEPVIAPAQTLQGSRLPFRRPMGRLGFCNDELVICPQSAAILNPQLPSSGRPSLRRRASPLSLLR